MTDDKELRAVSNEPAASPIGAPAAPTRHGGLGAVALTVVFSLWLIDAAIETFLSGAPVRWWVPGIVAAYLGLTAVVLWRGGPLQDRFSWSRRATASFFVLGIIDGTPYPDLFQGGSLWRRLPYWLQGAFISALVAVPLTIVVGMVDALKRLRATDGRTWGLRQSIALGLSVLMAMSGFTISSGRVASAVAGDGGGRQRSAEEITKPLANTYRALSRVLAGDKDGQIESPQEIAQRLEQLLQALEAAAKDIPRDTFDMAAVVEKVGRDPVKLFEWVRDETYLVPYRGLLRGQTGVLLDRLGNSLDRAVLLYAMLGSIGQTVRLARGALTDEQAGTLLEKARPVPPDGVLALSRPSSEPTEAGLRAYAQQQRLDSTTLRQAFDKVAVEQQRVREAVQNRVAQQAGAIAAAIGKPARNEDEEGAQRIQAVRDHWWVEWQSGTTWTALDPSLPDAAPGVTLAEVKATIQPGHLSDLGADQLHRIQLRVMVETWNRGQVSEASVLTRDLLPAELIGKSIVLRFVPVAWPRDLNLLEEKNPLAKLKSAVLAQSEWLPILQIDGQNIFRYTFNDYGDFNDTTLPGWAQAAMAGRILVHKTEKAVEGLGSRIGGILGGPKEKEAPAATPPSRRQVTAVWIDYELHSPGQAARTVRRDVLDVLGPAARTINPTPAPTMTEFERLERGLALMGETDILPLVSQLTPQFASHLLAAHLVTNRQVFLDLLRGDPKDLNAVGNRATDVKRLPTELYTLALARQQWSRFGTSVYFDRPNILSYHRRLRQDMQGRLFLFTGFDIVTNDVAVRSPSTVDPFVVRLEQGVLDTNTEALLALTCARASAEGGCGKVQNTSEMFTSTIGVDTRWVTVRDARDPEWQTVKVPGDVRARIEKDLAAGYIVMVPRSVVPPQAHTFFGWWRIERSTGQALGIGDRGWGQTAVEMMIFRTTYVIGMGSVAGLFCMAGDRIGTDYDHMSPSEEWRNLPETEKVATGKKWAACFLMGYVGAASVAFLGTMGSLQTILLLLSLLGGGLGV